MSDIELRMAWAAGETVGADPALKGVECPHGHRDIELRVAWEEGCKAGEVRRGSAELGSHASPI